MSKDVKFMEDQQWNCDEPIRKQLLESPQLFDDEVNEVLVKGTRSILIFIKGVMSNYLRTCKN